MLRSPLLSIILAASFSWVSGSAGQDAKVDFNRDVRPILSDNCYACHGPDEAQRQSDWRLDQPLGADSEIVRAGQPDDSELVTRILSDDADHVMPPSDHRKKLTDHQKQTLVRWIEEGADWQDQWAFRKLLVSPESANKVELKTEDFIDHFVRERLKEKGLSPSPAADRRTLIRRLYFDLIGMPPSFESVTEFENDQSTGAYEKVVDQLLASKHFGERMAIYWLDLVRYADSVGYHGDQEVSTSPYRDYVIDAFNLNMKFDQFTREQLAGDLLDDSTLDQKVASAYNRLGMMSAEGGVQPKEYLAKYAAERVRTTSTVWMGMTLGCAECHDHKFDPFSIDDFYNFASFFADIKEKGLYAGAHQSGKWGPTVDVADDDLEELLRPIDDQLSALKSDLDEAAKSQEFVAAQSKWESEIVSSSIYWAKADPISFWSANKIGYEIKDRSILVSGPKVNTDTYTIAFEVPRDKQAVTYRGMKIEVLPDSSLPQSGPGRAGNGNFVITELMLARGDLTGQSEELKKYHGDWPDELAKKRIELKNATATFEQVEAGGHPDKKWSAVSAIDRDKRGSQWGWAVMGAPEKSQELVVQLKTPIEFTLDNQNQIVTVVIQQNHGTEHLLGHFCVSFTESENAAVDAAYRYPGELLVAFGKPVKNRTDEETKTIHDTFKNETPLLEDIRKKIAAQEELRTQTVAAKTRSCVTTISVPPREMKVLGRGNWMDESGAVAMPKVPSVFDQIEKDGRATRLDLANWILQKDNPLTARVYVNRLWKLFYGTGLSKTLDDFGSQGEAPTHGELLDRLAIEFLNSDWDSKHMIKLLVMSTTYQQASTPRRELEEVDPYNRLFARQSRFRLDAEMIRDNALSVSGLLVNRIGGRSVKPYQPKGLYRHLNFPTRVYESDTDDNQYRRGLYTHWQRQFLHPAMKTFDAPSREECTCERPQSNTPLAALVLLNDPSYIEAARALADKTLLKDGGTESRIQTMVQESLSRNPTESELKVLTKLVESHLSQYRENRGEAKKLVEVGLSKPKSEVPVEELAAWTSVARTIMNMHEFIMRN